MPRIVTIAAALLVLGAASALYGLKYDARRLDALVQARERAIERLENDIAVLKTERAYLGRPARIEKPARAQGLGPVAGRQYERLQKVSEPVDDAIARLLEGPDGGR